VALILVTGCSSSSKPAGPANRMPPATASSTRSAGVDTASAAPEAAPSPNAPYAGPLFPKNRVVAYYGAANAPSLGVLGHEPPDRIVTKLEQQAHAYRKFGRPVIPAFELIAVIAHAAAGASGNYNGAIADATVQKYLDVIRAHRGILILDIQPGRAKFLPEAKRYEKFLDQPDVGLALDPEWEMGRAQIPGATIGGTTGAEVDGVGVWLASIVTAHHLPQKLFVLHEFTPDMIAGKGAIHVRPQLATTFHIDGFGSQAKKLGQYRLVVGHGTPGFFEGYKLFYTQDVDMMTPAEAMKVVPQPSLITYE